MRIDSLFCLVTCCAAVAGGFGMYMGGQAGWLGSSFLDGQIRVLGSTIAIHV